MSTEPRASTSSGLHAKQAEPRGGESLARLSDHLGRLLAHADKLLAEWQRHADEAVLRTLQTTLASAAQQASVELTRAYGANAEGLRADLERARQAAADLEAHMRRIAGGAKPTSVDELRAGLQGISAQLRALSPGQRSRVSTVVLVLAVTANLMLGGIAFLLWRAAPTAAPTSEAKVAPPPTAVAAAPDAGPAPPAPPPPPCSLALEPPVIAAKLVGACIAHLCPGKLSECRRDDAGAELVAALRALERERPVAKLQCPPPPRDPDGRYVVTVRWLLECPDAAPSPRPPAPGK